MLPSATVVAVFAVAHAELLNTPSSFMLVGGVSARSDMCLTGLENVGASLSCRAAVAELDGREIWSLSAGGALTSLASKKCLAVPSGAVAGARVALASCDGQNTAQLGSCREMGKSKSGSINMCLSQSGAAPGNADLVAASSSVIASSTLDFAHGAALAVDGLDSSYWVSKLDEASPVTLTVELASKIR